MEIENNVLILDGYTEGLPKLAEKATVRVWAVPTEYRESGYFVSVTPQGEPPEIPACDSAAAEFIGVMELEADPAAVLKKVKEEKAKAARDAADAFLDALNTKYSKYEEKSWPKQEAQATELTADPNAAAPFVRRMAARRGIDIEVLRQKIMDNVAAADFVASDILGQQQAYEDQIRAAETIEEIYAIQFDYEVPELPGEGGNG